MNWEELVIPKDLASLIPLESIERYRFIPFKQKDDALSVAVVDVSDINTQNALNFFARKNKKELKIVPVTADEFDIILRKIKNPETEIGQALERLEETTKEDEEKNLSNVRKRRNNISVLQEAPVAKMVEVILKNAIDGKASDIHVEPMDEKVRVRYRVDGILYDSITLPRKVGPAIVSRIKILSNLKIDEKRKPQDGRFRIDDLGRTIDFRVSTFPVSTGEKVVLRILDKSQGLISLEDLGLAGKGLDSLRKTMEEPYGIILVTGPTGSGKSTTLYSVLSLLNKEGVNIVTLEDPVEYVVEGISQSQVRPEIGYTFASGLRSILRQDPDIIMVGEIRDSETAELAIHAALTGHLVLSTLHTNTAIGAVPRLIDMGIQPFLIASSLKLVIGQRLVRRICPECSEKKTESSKDLIRMVQNELSKMSQDVLDQVEIGNIDAIDKLSLYYGKGCNHCHGKGYKGRVGIYEILYMNDKLNRLISNNANQEDIEKEALSSGYTTMKQDGIIKALSGMTTMEEVQRVTEDEDEEEVIEAKGE